MNKILIIYNPTTGKILSQGSKDGSWSVVAKGVGKIQGGYLKSALILSVPGYQDFDLGSAHEGDQIHARTQAGMDILGGKDGKFDFPTIVPIPGQEPPPLLEESVTVEVRRWSDSCSWSSEERAAAIEAKQIELGLQNLETIVVVTSSSGIDPNIWRVGADKKLERAESFDYE